MTTTQSGVSWQTYDPAFTPFWEHVLGEELAFPRCAACERFQWYPLARCARCGSDDLPWQAVAGAGRLYSWTVVRYAFTPEFADQVPYTIGLVEFDDAPGVRLLTRVENPDGRQLACGMAVAPVFGNDGARDAGERPLVTFIPA